MLRCQLCGELHVAWVGVHAAELDEHESGVGGEDEDDRADGAQPQQAHRGPTVGESGEGQAEGHCSGERGCGKRVNQQVLGVAEVNTVVEEWQVEQREDLRAARPGCDGGGGGRGGSRQCRGRGKYRKRGGCRGAQEALSTRAESGGGGQSRERTMP